MRAFKQNSLLSKGSAIGFVILILFANLWLTFLLTKQKAPDFIVIGFFTGLLIAVVFGVCLTISTLLECLNIKKKGR